MCSPRSACCSAGRRRSPSRSPAGCRPGVSAKDLVLAIIGRIGVNGGTGHVIEYRGPAIEALSMDERMTVCNMSIEAGARAGMVAPDETTFAYLHGRPRAPQGEAWERAVADWRDAAAPTPGAAFDQDGTLDAAAVEPMITYGTNPGMVAPVSGRVPERPGDAVFARSLEYMGLAPGEPLRDQPVQVVFVGSCTNARLSDLEPPRGCSPAARWRRACACWWCRARSRSSARPRNAASPGCSSMPAPSGASRAARCASA